MEKKTAVGTREGAERRDFENPSVLRRFFQKTRCFTERISLFFPSAPWAGWGMQSLTVIDLCSRETGQISALHFHEIAAGKGISGSLAEIFRDKGSLRWILRRKAIKKLFSLREPFEKPKKSSQNHLFLRFSPRAACNKSGRKHLMTEEARKAVEADELGIVTFYRTPAIFF